MRMTSRRILAPKLDERYSSGLFNPLICGTRESLPRNANGRAGVPVRARKGSDDEKHWAGEGLIKVEATGRVSFKCQLMRVLLSVAVAEREKREGRQQSPSKNAHLPVDPPPPIVALVLAAPSRPRRCTTRSRWMWIGTINLPAAGAWEKISPPVSERQ